VEVLQYESFWIFQPTVPFATSCQEAGDPVSPLLYSVSVRVLSDSFINEWMNGGGGGLVVE
jgi:hypothetical protein